MPLQPPATSIDETTPLNGKPQRQDDIFVILRDIQNRLDRIESVLGGGVLLTSDDGSVRVRLTVDNDGQPVWTII